MAKGRYIGKLREFMSKHDDLMKDEFRSSFTDAPTMERQRNVYLRKLSDLAYKVREFDGNGYAREYIKQVFELLTKAEDKHRTNSQRYVDADHALSLLHTAIGFLALKN